MWITESLQLAKRQGFDYWRYQAFKQNANNYNSEKFRNFVSKVALLAHRFFDVFMTLPNICLFSWMINIEKYPSEFLL